MDSLQSPILATALVGRLEQTDTERAAGLTRLRWSNPGHPSPIVVTADGRQVQVLATDHADHAPLIIAGFRLFPPVYDALVGPLLKVFGYARDDVPPTDGNVFEPVPTRTPPAAPTSASDPLPAQRAVRLSAPKARVRRGRGRRRG